MRLSVFSLKACFRVLMAVTWLVLGASGCTQDGEMDFGGHAHALVGGQPAQADVFDAVVALVASIGDKRIVYCSGTLIAPDIVLTAAHCLTGDETLDVPLLLETGRVHVVSGRHVDDVGAGVWPVADFRVHPDYVVGERHDDLALIRLPEPSGIAPWGLGDHPASVSDAVMMAGFGDDGDGVSGQRSVTSAQIDFACERPSGTCQTLVDDRRVYVPANAFVHLYRGSGTCFGDSGGPVFVESDGGMQVVGVHARVDGTCRLYSISVSTWPYADWFRDAWHEDVSCSAAVRKKAHFGGYMGYVLAGMAILCLKRLRKKRRRHGVSDACGVR